MTGETETNEHLDGIEALLIEINDKFMSRVFWGVLGALVAFALLVIVFVIVAGAFLAITIADVQP